MIYLGARHFLPEDHRFRRARASFNLRQELQLSPQRPTGEEVLRWGLQRSKYLSSGGVENGNDDPVKLHGVKRHSIFFELPYWKVSSLRKWILKSSIIYEFQILGLRVIITIL